MEHGTQMRCRDCATGWVVINSQEDVPSASHRLCEACIKKVHSQRTERRAQDPKPRGRPPKQAQKKSNRGRPRKSNVRDEDNDGDEPAASPTAAPRPRGRPRKQRPNTDGHTTAEPSPELPTRLSTRHTRRGSELAPPPKRPRPLRNVLDE